MAIALAHAWKARNTTGATEGYVQVYGVTDPFENGVPIVAMVILQSATADVTAVRSKNGAAGYDTFTSAGAIQRISITGATMGVRFFYLTAPDDFGGGDGSYLRVVVDTSCNFVLAAAQFTGMDTAAMVDAVTVVASSTGTTLSVNLTTATANAMIIAYGQTEASPGPTAHADYTAITIPELGYNDGQFDVDAGAAGLRAVSMTCNDGTWGIAAMSFKAEGAPVTAIPVFMYHYMNH